MSDSNKKTLQFILILISVLLIFTIAVSMESIRFSEGRVADQSAEAANPFGGEIPEDDVYLLARILGILLIISFVTSIVMLFVSKEARKRFLRWIILAALFTLIYSFPRPGDQGGTTIPPEESIINLTPFVGEISGGEAVFTEQITQAPNWVVTILSFIVSILLLGIIVFFALRKKPQKPLDKVAEEAQKAIDAIGTGANFKDIIIRCYHEMSQALAVEQNLTRNEEMTPREFKRILINHGFPKNEVDKLTNLFEKVRYGSIQPSKDDEVIAISSLKAILNSL